EQKNQLPDPTVLITRLHAEGYTPSPAGFAPGSSPGSSVLVGSAGDSDSSMPSARSSCRFLPRSRLHRLLFISIVMPERLILVTVPLTPAMSSSSPDWSSLFSLVRRL